VAQGIGVGPEFQPQYHKKKKKKVNPQLLIGFLTQTALFFSGLQGIFTQLLTQSYHFQRGTNGQQHAKRCSTALVIMEIKIKTSESKPAF
jgi:hypothetical protein